MPRTFATSEANKYLAIINKITSLVFPVVDATTGETLYLKLDSHDAMTIVEAIRPYLVGL